MNVVKDTFRDLVQRRLWPIALALLLMLVAVPMLLKATPDEPAPAPATAPTVAVEGADGLTSEPLVAVNADGQVDRRVLGARKDPFKPSGKRASASSGSESDAGGSSASGGPASAGAATDGGPGSGSGASGGSGVSGSTGGSTDGGSTGGSIDGGSTGGSSPTPTPDVAPAPPSGGTDSGEKALDLYSLTVAVDGKRLGDPLERLQPLIGDTAPAIIYLGLLEDGKTAVFLLEEGVSADGDGTCSPSPENCQRVHLRQGETEFFTGEIEGEAVDDAPATPQKVDFQLDILKLTTKTTSSASKARTARAAASSAGRRALRSRTGRMGRLRYDRTSGMLHKLSVKAYRTSMARASQRRAGLGSGSAARPSGPRVSLGGGPYARASGRRAGLGTP